MARRRKKRMRAGALALVAAGGAAAAYVISRRDSGGDDRVAAPASAGPVAEPSLRAHAVDAAEAPVPVRPATATASSPGDGLSEPEHGAPEGAVMPDTSSDPLVEAETAAAEAQAGAIGGNAQTMGEDGPAIGADPAERPVLEGSGDSEETFEAGEVTRDRDKPQ